MRPFSPGALLALALVAAPRLAIAEGPPREHGRFREPDLVEVQALDPSIKVDVRYATANNFVGRPVYSVGRVFLQRPAAEALVRAQARLRDKGVGLLLFDGYRPWTVTKLFWDVTPPNKRAFVANPASGSKHNRGCAVDLSLYDLETGAEIEMPSAYDEMSARSAPRYEGGTPEQRARRDLLRKTLEGVGFSVDKGEWWHYNYKDWQQYTILDVSFEDLVARPAAR